MSTVDRMAAIKRLKENIQQKVKNGDNGGAKSFGDPRYFPFFAIKVDQKCTLRFLPDLDEENQNVFFREQKYYEWEFNDPENPGALLKVKMPSRNMFKPKSDPVYQTIAKLFRDEDPMARKVYQNLNFLMSGLVRQSDFVEDPVSPHRVRLFDMNKNLFKTTIEAALGTTDEESPLFLAADDPTSLTAGLDYIVRKTQAQGAEFPSYSTSAFSRKSSALTEDELAVVESEGLLDLKSYLMKEPENEAAWDLQPIMLEALLNNEMWNPDWEEFWKPIRPRKKDEDGSTAGTKATAPMAKIKPAKEVVATPVPAVEPDEASAEPVAAPKVTETKAAEPKAASSSTADLLARIRAKQTS